MKPLNFLVNVLLIFWISASSAQEIDFNRVLGHMEILASDSLQGRKTGTEGGRLAREYLIKEFSRIGLSAYFPDYIQNFSFKQGRVTYNGTNVVGFIEGRSPAAIVISAHYDHLGMEDSLIYNGADDNASGVAAMIEIAEYFSANQPNHTLVFCGFDAEELGLRGSKAFMSSSAVDPLEYTLNINMDMISRSDRGVLFAVGTSHFPYFKTILPLGKKGEFVLATGHDDASKPRENWTYSSDHAAFFREGIPFIYFGVDDHPDYHKASDTFLKIDPVFYEFSVNIILQSIIKIDQALYENEEE